jgi:hypothetical protein
MLHCHRAVQLLIETRSLVGSQLWAILTCMCLIQTSRNCCAALDVDFPSSQCNSSTILINSNTTYTLMNCLGGVTGGGVFITLTPNASTDVLQNVTVNVVGGNVLPRIKITATDNDTLKTVRFISIHLLDVTVVNQHINVSTAVDDVYVMSVLYIQGVLNISSISISAVNTSITLSAAAVGSLGSALKIGLLLLVAGTSGGSKLNLRSVSINISNTQLRLNITGNGNASNVVGVMQIQAGEGAIDDVGVTISNMSDISIVMNSSHLLQSYSKADQSLFSIVSLGKSLGIVTGVYFNVFGGSNLSYEKYFPLAGNNSDEAISILSVVGVGVLRGVAVVMRDNVSCRTRSVCRGLSCTSTNLTLLKTFIVLISGGADRTSTLANISFTLQRTSIVLDSPKSTLCLSVRDARELRSLTANISDSVFNISSTVLRFQKAPRIQAMIDIANVNNATLVDVIISRVTADFVAESGGCNAANVALVNLLDNISLSTVSIDHVVMRAFTFNGTVVPSVIEPYMVSAAMLTMSTFVVNIAGGSNSLSVGEELFLSVSNTSMYVTQATTVQADGSAIILILAVASIANVIRSLRNCSFLFSDVHVVRDFIGISSSYPTPNPMMTMVRLNITSIVTLFDGGGMALAAVPSALQSFAAKELPSSTNVIHTDVLTSLSSNCTVVYSNDVHVVIPGEEDLLSLVVLPQAAIACVMDIRDSHLPPSSSHFGSIVAAVGSVRLANTHVSAQRVTGLSMLFSVVYGNLTVKSENVTALIFEDISLDMRPCGRSINQYVMGVGSTKALCSNRSPSCASRAICCQATADS